MHGCTGRCAYAGDAYSLSPKERYKNNSMRSRLVERQPLALLAFITDTLGARALYKSQKAKFGNLCRACFIMPINPCNLSHKPAWVDALVRAACRSTNAKLSRLRCSDVPPFLYNVPLCELPWHPNSSFTPERSQDELSAIIRVSRTVRASSSSTVRSILKSITSQKSSQTLRGNSRNLQESCAMILKSTTSLDSQLS